MGEEEKKPAAAAAAEEKKPTGEPKKAEEEKKVEEPPKAEEKAAAAADEKKPEESKDGGGGGGADAPAGPPPSKEIVLRVYMHCEGCARKVRRCLKGFDGVEDVVTDCKTHKVVVKGEKADPLKVLERVQRKSHRQVELLSPIPTPPPEEPKKPEVKEVKPEEKKEEPKVITVVLKVHMHCEACAQEIRKRILRMKGVENAEPDLKSSQVTVKGTFEPPYLVEYVYKRTGKHAGIVKVEPEAGKEDENPPKESGKEEEEKKTAEGGGGGGGEKKEEEAKKGEEGGKDKKEGGEPDKPPSAAEQEDPKMELKKNELYYYYPQNYQVNPQSFAAYQEVYAHPPQIFSDENPNACSVM